MRREATNNITTLLVEASDERTSVLAELARFAGQRVIVVLSVEAAFRRPSDLRELEQAAAYADVELILVMAHNEGLRLWARRQGFTVFSSLEGCAKSQALGALMLPRSSGQFKVPGVPMTRQTPRITEPLYARHTVQYGAVHVHDLSQEFSRSNVSNTPAAEIQFVDVQQALQRQIEEEKAQDYRAAPFSLLPDAGLSADPIVETPTAQLAAVQTVQTGRSAIWHDRLLFVLVALLALGIVGGVGFSYLLSLAHGAPGTFSFSSLTLLAQVVHP